MSTNQQTFKMRGSSLGIGLRSSRATGMLGLQQDVAAWVTVWTAAVTKQLATLWDQAVLLPAAEHSKAMSAARQGGGDEPNSRVRL